MKHTYRGQVIPIAAILLLVAGGAGAQTLPAATPDAAKTAPKKVPKKAVCAVCRSGPEPVAATFVYKGKTYYFCQESCKAEFQEDPEKHIKAGAAEAGHQHPKPAGGSAAPS